MYTLIKGSLLCETHIMIVIMLPEPYRTNFCPYVIINTTVNGNLDLQSLKAELNSREARQNVAVYFGAERFWEANHESYLCYIFPGSILYMLSSTLALFVFMNVL